MLNSIFKLIGSIFKILFKAFLIFIKGLKWYLINLSLIFRDFSNNRSKPMNKKEKEIF